MKLVSSSPREDVRQVVLRHPAGAGAVGNEPRERVELDARLDGQRERVGKGGDVDEPEQVREQLGRRAGADWADMVDGATEGFEQRPGALEVARLGSDHERQRAVARTVGSPGDRRVDEPDRAAGRFVGQAPNDRRRDRAHVDEQRAGAQGREHRGGDGLELGRAGDGGHEQLRPRGELGEARGRLHPVSLGRCHALWQRVEARDLEACPHGVPGHGPAHAPEAGEADQSVSCPRSR